MTIQGGKARRDRENRVAATKFSQGLCRVSLDATQAWSGTVDIQWDTVDSDVNGWYSTSTYKYTPKSPGTYLVSACISAGAALGAPSFLEVWKNGASYYVLNKIRNTSDRSLNGSCMVDMNGSSDYITVSISPANSVNSTGVVTENYLNIVQIGYNKP